VIDGVGVATINLHATSLHYRRIVFAKSWVTSGTHTIRIVVSGTAGHARVDLDALVVIR
jgi:archaellin